MHESLRLLAAAMGPKALKVSDVVQNTLLKQRATIPPPQGKQSEEKKQETKQEAKPHASKGRDIDLAWMDGDSFRPFDEAPSGSSSIGAVVPS